MKVAQLKRLTGFSDSTLYSAFGGKQLPSQQVTLAIVEACGGNLAAWRSYWSDVRRSLDRDAPDGRQRAVIPPWAAPAGSVGDAGESGDLVGVVNSPAATIEAQPATAPLVDHDTSASQPTGRRLLRRPTWLVVIALVVTVAAASATITALVVSHGRSTAVGNAYFHPPWAVVIVQNKDAIGRSSLLEDSVPAYLSTAPVPRCRLQGCEVMGTDMSSGADLVATCWVRGAEMTNEDTTSEGIAQNPNGVTSTLWYRGVWPNGRRGYLSAVYVAPRYRGGLGLRRCKG